LTPALGDVRILLVDDHDIVRSGLRALVEGTPGLQVVGEARDGAEALSRVRDLKPDVVVMDLSMPGMDGATATERIVRDHPGARVVALTAHEDRAHLARLLQAGAAGYVLKRGAVDELVRAIRVVAQGGVYVDPALAGRVLSRGVRSGRLAPTAVTDQLSEREEDVLRLIAWGNSNKEVADRLGISTKTVETYKSRISGKLGLRSRTEMVRYAVERGWLTEGE
jgi:DNA-binding NarL/FixJ family response regulator